MSEYPDNEDEYIENLLKMNLPKHLTNPYLLGDRTSYKLPKKISWYLLTNSN